MELKLWPVELSLVYKFPNLEFALVESRRNDVAGI